MIPEWVAAMTAFGPLSAFLAVLVLFLNHLKSRDADVKTKDLQQIEAQKASALAIVEVAALHRVFAEKCLAVFENNIGMLVRVEKCLETLGCEMRGKKK